MTENKNLLSTILVIIIVGLCFFWFRQIGPGDAGSPEIENKDIIEHGKNGFLPVGEKQWIEVLSKLIENKELRKKIT